VGAQCDDDGDCNVPATCKRADPSGVRQHAAAATGDRIATDPACVNAIGTSQLDTCDVTLPGVVACVIHQAESAARAVADAVFPEGRVSP
jgi:hypothetical protein